MLFFLLSCSPESFDRDADFIALFITPTQLLLPVGSSTQLRAFGLGDNRESIDITESVSWHVEDEGLATISEDLDQEGVLTTQQVGNTRIHVTYNDLASPFLDVIITSAELERLSISPNTIDIVEGDKMPLKATGYFSNGETGDLTQQARWITEDGSILRFPEAGLAQAVSMGETRIHISYENISSDSIPVQVQELVYNGKPDLIIDEASGYILNGVAYYDVKIKNQGSKSAEQFWVDVWGNRSEEPQANDVGDHYILIPYLSPNHYTTVTLEFPYSGSSAQSWIEVDGPDDITESHEYNNTYTLEIVEDSPNDTDLSITYFETMLNSDGTQSFFVDVHNNGTQNIEYVFVDLYVDQHQAPTVGSDGQHYIALENISPGETKWADFIHDSPCIDCTSWVMVDSLNFIVESDESNNIAGPISIEY